MMYWGWGKGHCQRGNNYTIKSLQTKKKIIVTVKEKEELIKTECQSTATIVNQLAELYKLHQEIASAPALQDYVEKNDKSCSIISGESYLDWYNILIHFSISSSLTEVIVLTLIFWRYCCRFSSVKFIDGLFWVECFKLIIMLFMFISRTRRIICNFYCKTGRNFTQKEEGWIAWTKAVDGQVWQGRWCTCWERSSHK